LAVLFRVIGTLLIFPLCNDLALIGTFEGVEGAKGATELRWRRSIQIYSRDNQFSYQMAHNEKIMRETDFLADQERCIADDHRTALGW